jgi:hypothetical protein
LYNFSSNPGFRSFYYDNNFEIIGNHYLRINVNPNSQSRIKILNNVYVLHNSFFNADINNNDIINVLQHNDLIEKFMEEHNPQIREDIKNELVLNKKIPLDFITSRFFVFKEPNININSSYLELHFIIKLYFLLLNNIDISS